MIFAIPLAEKILAGVSAIASAAGDSASTASARAATRAADTAEFGRSLDKLDRAAASPLRHAAHATNRAAAPTQG